MKSLPRLAVLAVNLLLVFAFSGVYASSEDFGDYRVHYNAFNSDMLSPQIAQTYDIKRSSYRGVLNIAVQRQGQNGYRAVPAKVDGYATNLAGQLKRIEFQEVREGEAIYYIGQFWIANRDILNFRINVTPEAEKRAFPIQFQQQFYTD